MYVFFDAIPIPKATIHLPPNLDTKGMNRWGGPLYGTEDLTMCSVYGGRVARIYQSGLFWQFWCGIWPEKFYCFEALSTLLILA